MVSRTLAATLTLVFINGAGRQWGFCAPCCPPHARSRSKNPRRPVCPRVRRLATGSRLNENKPVSTHARRHHSASRYVEDGLAGTITRGLCPRRSETGCWNAPTRNCAPLSPRLWPRKKVLRTAHLFSIAPRGKAMKACSRRTRSLSRECNSAPTGSKNESGGEEWAKSSALQIPGLDGQSR